MKNKIINFSDLGRQEVRCIVYTDNEGMVHAEYAQEEIAKLQREMENPILVYNTNKETQMKLQTLISKAGQGVFKDKKDIAITAKELMIDYLPLCTNINLNLDKEKDKEEIEKIINEPNDEFAKVIREVSKIIKKSSKDYAEDIENFNSLSDAEKEKVMKAVQPKIEETEEEKELREAEESLKVIKAKMKKKKDSNKTVKTEK